jgi:hypothetical protein
MLRFFFERIYILDIKGLGLILLSGAAFPSREFPFSTTRGCAGAAL